MFNMYTDFNKYIYWFQYIKSRNSTFQSKMYCNRYQYFFENIYKIKNIYIYPYLKYSLYYLIYLFFFACFICCYVSHVFCAYFLLHNVNKRLRYSRHHSLIKPKKKVLPKNMQIWEYALFQQILSEKWYWQCVFTVIYRSTYEYIIVKFLI